MLPKWWVWALGGLLLGGCSYPVREQADQAVCDLAAHALDPTPPQPADQHAPEATPEEGRELAGKGGAGEKTGEEEPTLPPPTPLPGKGGKLELADRLRIPPGLIPGGRPAPIELPEDPAKRRAYLEQLYPPLPPVGPDPQARPGPEGRPLTLSDLQRLALANSPLVRQAAADVESARGAAIQAGAYPNPNFGYQWDTAGTGETAGYQGAFVEQTIKTGGKLKLAQAAAIMDLLNAQLALRRAQTDLAGQVRGAYFAVLVARETMGITEALVRLTDEAFRIQLEQTRISAAPYEPMQLRVLSYQARDALVTARTTYVSSWKQLAATLGLPGMPLTELAGRADMPIPLYRHDAVLARVLNSHTDVLTAANTLQRARYNLEAARVTPVPDVSLHIAVEHDFTMPPFQTTTTGTVGVPLPIWDLNKGNIIQMQGALLRAAEEAHRVRDDLTGRVADAFGRYERTRIRLELYREHILPDQVRAYQGVRVQHNWDPDAVGFGDVVTAQQTLAGVVTTYVGALGDMWTAVTDLSTLLQTDDLFQVGPEKLGAECPAGVPDLEHLPPLPCCHPCNPLPDPRLKGADGSWPAPLPVQLPVPKPTSTPAEGKETEPAAPPGKEGASPRTGGATLRDLVPLNEGPETPAAPPR